MIKKVGFKKEKVFSKNLRKSKKRKKFKWGSHGIKISKSLSKNSQTKQGNSMQSFIAMKVSNKTTLLKTMISRNKNSRSTS